MRPLPWSHLERYRLRLPGKPWDSEPGDDCGVFIIQRKTGTAPPLRTIASAGDEEMPWEHVSVSLEDRCPTWDEMAYVKSLFWLPTETVMQLHVPDAEHRNFHPYTLHLWRPKYADIPRPPGLAVA
jgi:hypothetical protein